MSDVKIAMQQPQYDVHHDAWFSWLNVRYATIDFSFAMNIKNDPEDDDATRGKKLRALFRDAIQSIYDESRRPF